MKILDRFALATAFAKPSQPRTAGPSWRLPSSFFRQAGRALAVLFVPMLFVACPTSNTGGALPNVDAQVLAASFLVNGENANATDRPSREHSVQVAWPNPRVSGAFDNDVVSIIGFELEVRRLGADADAAAMSPGMLTLVRGNNAESIAPTAAMGFTYRINQTNVAALGLSTMPSPASGATSNTLTIRGLAAGNYDVRLLRILYTNDQLGASSAEDTRAAFEVVNPPAPADLTLTVAYTRANSDDDANGTISWTNPTYNYGAASGGGVAANIAGLAFSVLVDGSANAELTTALNAALAQQQDDTAAADFESLSANISAFAEGEVDLTLTISYERADTTPQSFTPGTTTGTVTLDLSNPDNDAYPNLLDVDDDGNGLIELRTATELNMMRNNLAGTGLSATAGMDGDQTGCLAGAGTQIACEGYELLADVDLGDLPAVTETGYVGSNWVPVGLSTDRFAANFNGNGNTISNLRLRIVTTAQGEGVGVGLFGYAAATAEISNLSLSGVSIEDADTDTDTVQLGSVGALIGDAAAGVVVSNVVATVTNIGTAAQPAGTNVGGLIGVIGGGSESMITNSAVVAGSITANNANVGGLVGSLGAAARVNASAAIVTSISGSGNAAVNVGGLVGAAAANTMINDSYAALGHLAGSGEVGGLIGNAQTSTGITNSLALSRQIAAPAAGDFHPVVAGTNLPGDVTASYYSNASAYEDLADTPMSIDASTITGDRGDERSATQLQEATDEGLDMATPTPTDTFVDWRNGNDSLCAAAGEQIWTFGTAMQYPAINCFGTLLTPEQQRTEIEMVLMEPEMMEAAQ